MTVSRVACLNWRNITECDIPLCDGINVLWGMNAQGKSNILECIYFFARGRSFRGAREKELIRFGSDYSVARVDFLRDGYTHDTALEATLTQSGKKRLTRNDAPLTPAEMMGSFRAVLFCPANLTVVSGGPLERRTFLDVALSQLSPKYLSCVRRYSHLLAERNALLKQAASGQSVSAEEWEVYAEAMSEQAAWIAAFRREYTEMLNAAVGRYFSGMTGGREVPQLTYTSHALTDEMPSPLSKPGKEPDRSVLISKLTENIEREIAAGSTLWGTHKDDIGITLNGKEAKLYASQGQQRSIVLSMKLGEAEIAREIGGEYPVILLDDVFSELDEERRKYILSSLGGGNRQIIITSCEPDVIPEKGTGRVNFLRVENGEVRCDGTREAVGDDD